MKTFIQQMSFDTQQHKIMKLYKVYTSLGDHDGYFCLESGDIGIKDYCPCEDDEIIEGYNPKLGIPEIYQQNHSGEEINSTQEEISNYTPPPLPAGYEDFLKNQEDSEG